MGTNIYFSSDDLLYWSKDGLLADHSMSETYMKLIEGYIDGSIPSYDLDTDLFYSDFYDISGKKNLTSFVDTAEDIVKVLKLGKYTVKTGTWGYELLQKLGMLE